MENIIPTPLATPSGNSGPDGHAAARKPTIMLHYGDDALGLEKRLLFEAAGPAAALDVAAGEAAGRNARLFVDGEPLCSLLKADEDFPYWIVGASGPAPNELSVSEMSEDEP
ncbi:hypothetical protein [Sphingopyxis sp. KK2]|uniref:hypothetical protein n=1 Tax=Sphingopyxis sp. KK2 TaxID=1855727 RepID=UPI001181AA5C|nr:hypothetical protein [Sphingopyxis sp. KK2]